jgi:pimeloyl-ACP methyl ester carboxylesterase
MQQILFIQGGGAGVHDEWDDKLVASLRGELGDGYEISYPRMPDEDEPNYAKWSEAIGREAKEMDDGGILIGHSIGGAIALQAIAERPPAGGLDAIILVAAPFIGKGGWPGDDFEFADNLGARLPAGVPVHIFHGSADDTAPPAHAQIYARAIPQAKLHRLPGRDHQLGNDLSEVAEVVRGLGK